MTFRISVDNVRCDWQMVSTQVVSDSSGSLAYVICVFVQFCLNGFKWHTLQQAFRLVTLASEVQMRSVEGQRSQGQTRLAPSPLPEVAVWMDNPVAS